MSSTSLEHAAGFVLLAVGLGVAAFLGAAVLVCALTAAPYNDPTDEDQS